jgi:C1A family cysteine protease
MKLLKRGGWKPDLPDQRDYTYPLPKRLYLPKFIDLRAGCSPVEDQKALGSCTAQAIVGDREYRLGTAEPLVNLSRLFVYYYERQLEGTVAYDSGASLRDGIKVLAKYGVCPESFWPYRIKDFTRQPTNQCMLAAVSRKITSYRRLNTLQEMRHCLAQRSPFVFGFTVYQSFESAAVAKTGIANLPGPGEQILGGHAVLCVGYDDSTKRFLCRNSWGRTWGQHGYFTLPYAYLESRDLSDDFWQIIH